MNCEEKVRAFIADEQLLRSDGRYIVALSGGADSVALLTIMLRLGYSIEAAHCNFNLRGDESKRDEAFVKSLCEARQVPLHIIHFDTRTYASLHKVSIEMAARELRYHYFEQLLNDIGADAVCVAHHRDDSVETLLMNLIRGTGIHGLTGIRPRNGNVLRPLLCLSRRDIEEYLESLGQDYVTDSSNLVPDVVRNKIRLQLLPLLQTINPAAADNIAQTARYLAEAEKVYNAAIEGQRAKLFDEQESRGEVQGGKFEGQRLEVEGVKVERQHSSLNVQCSTLLNFPSPLCLLFEILRPYGFTSAQVEDIASHLNTNCTSSLFSSATHDVIIDRGRLIVEPHNAPQPTLRIPEPGNYVYTESQRLRLTVTQGANVSRNAAIATLDADKLRFPLILRPVVSGDRFVPFGMKGSRLVSDYLTDRKLNLLEKRRQLVLTTADNHIIWLVGQRTDNRYCIDNNTQRTLTVELKDESE